MSGLQNFPVIVLHSNQSNDNKNALACASQHVGFVDLLCTIPVTICGSPLKALVDTAANHSMIPLEFLQTHNIPYCTLASLSYGISGTSAPCLGSVILTTYIEKQCNKMKYTIVASLPPAAAHLNDPNLALLGLGVISTARMRITFDTPHMLVTVPPPAHALRSKPFTHMITRPATEDIAGRQPGLDPLLQSKRQQKTMFKRAMTGNMPLFAVHVKPLQPDVCAVSRKSYLSQQQPPAHTPQDTSLVPPCVLVVMNKFTSNISD